MIGPSTEIVAGEGRILTAGAVDCHVHLRTLLVAVADETAQTEGAARACLNRWRDEVLGPERLPAMIGG